MNQGELLVEQLKSSAMHAAQMRGFGWAVTTEDQLEGITDLEAAAEQAREMGYDILISKGRNRFVQIRSLRAAQKPPQAS